MPEKVGPSKGIREKKTGRNSDGKLPLSFFFVRSISKGRGLLTWGHVGGRRDLDQTGPRQEQFELFREKRKQGKRMVTINHIHNRRKRGGGENRHPKRGRYIIRIILKFQSREITEEKKESIQKTPSKETKVPYLRKTESPGGAQGHQKRFFFPGKKRGQKRKKGKDCIGAREDKDG